MHLASKQVWKMWGKKKKAFCISKGDPPEEDRFTSQHAVICSNFTAKTILVKAEDGGV